MIPKIIHYCWFGYNPKPKLAKQCIKSWKKFCPDYKIIEWNEDNYDIASAPLYVRQAYEAKKWAFVTDYVRLEVIYKYGGVYLDTDVELVKDLSTLLNCKAYFGFQDDNYVATGLGFGAIQGCEIIKELLLDYQKISFIKDDESYDQLACPKRNMHVFERYGLIQNNKFQILKDDIYVYPTDYFCPKTMALRLKMSQTTYSIHWFSASWWDNETRKKVKRDVLKWKLDRLFHIPHRILHFIIGDDKYKRLKNVLKIQNANDND